MWYKHTPNSHWSWRLHPAKNVNQSKSKQKTTIYGVRYKNIKWNVKEIFIWLTVTVHSTTQCYITNVRHVCVVMSTFPDDYIANVRRVFAVMSTFPDESYFA